MTKKNHHFVPQFYLRNFSYEKAAICLVNISSGAAIPTASIKNQCYRKRFYGETNELEDALSVVEANAASVIKKVIDGETVSRFSNTHEELLRFVALQRLRTVATVEMISRLLSLPMSYLAREYSRRSGKENDDIRVVVEQDVTQMLGLLEDFIRFTRDLDIRVLRSCCDASFITSDNPVVYYNQWCEGVKQTGVLGVASGGLQVFFPLAPNCSLMFFDEIVYDVSNKKTGEIEIHHPRDVFQLNKLQTTFAQDNLYFADWREKERILDALPKVEPLRKEYRQTQNIAGSETEDDYSEIIHMYMPMPDLHLKLRFSKIRRSMKAIPMFERSQSFRHELGPLAIPEKPDQEHDQRMARRFELKSTETWQDEWENIVS